MKKCTPKKESFGTVTAAKEREKANGFTDERREALTHRGMALIYGGDKHSKVKANNRRS